MDYQKVRVEINCQDNAKYTRVAFLVDRKDFLKDILHYRKRWLETDKPLLSKSFDAWFSSLSKNGITRDQLLRGDEIARLKSFKAKQLIDRGKKTEAKKLIRDLDLLFKKKLRNIAFKGDVNELLLRYKVPSTCFKAVARAVICGVVEDSDWDYCSLILKPSGVEGERIIPTRNKPEPSCEIIITPYLLKKDWDSIFRSNKDKIKELYQNSSYGYRKYAKKTISNIRRDRRWYWANKNGMSYAKIWKELENEAGNSHDYIDKAIQQYKKNLNA